MEPALKAVVEYEATLKNHPNPPAANVTKFSSRQREGPIYAPDTGLEGNRSTPKIGAKSVASA